MAMRVEMQLLAPVPSTMLFFDAVHGRHEPIVCASPMQRRVVIQAGVWLTYTAVLVVPV